MPLAPWFQGGAVATHEQNQAPRAWPAAACRHSPRRAGARSGAASDRRSPCHGTPTRQPPRCTGTTGWGGPAVVHDRRLRAGPLIGQDQDTAVIVGVEDLL